MLALLLAACKDDAAAPTLRSAPAVPKPTEDQKVEYLYRLFTSGEEVDLAGKRIRVWRKVGEPGLQQLGAPALRYLLSKDRYPEYHRSTNILANVLRLLPTQPNVAAQPEFYPFLLHFLDPANYAPQSEGGVDADTFRKTIFAIFTRFPDPRAAPACIEELDKEKRTVDLRNEAIVVLLRTGHAEEVRKRYKDFGPEQRLFTLVRLYEAADPKMKEDLRQVAAAFRPQLEEALDSDNAFHRLYAAGTLLRLGDKAMADRLLSEHARALKEKQLDPAWFAVRILAQDRADERAYELARQQAGKKVMSLAGQVAIELLFRYWIDKPEAQALLWKVLENTKSRLQLDLRIVNALLKVDRPKTVAYLKRLVFGKNHIWRDNALRFIQTNRTVTEAGAWIIELLRKESDAHRRSYYYGILTVLRTNAVVPLARAELKDNADVVAAGVVIAFDDKKGLDQVGALVRRGNRPILDYLLQQALLLGKAGVPEALLDDLLYALQNLPGDQARMKVLQVLRLRGTAEGVLEGLIDAYQREKSRRVAAQIETVIEELVHR